MFINQSAPVLVTGVTGYVASWIVKYLLEDGYTVHGTVRSVAKKEKYAHLTAIEEETKGTLKLFEADLEVEGSFIEAMKGCELVIHTASPFFVSGIKNAEEQLIKPAVNGTSNVLETASATPTVKRVVLTSSCAAIYGDNEDMKETPNFKFDESIWNTSSSLNHQPYSYSKTMAERKGWEIAGKQKQWDLVTINPAFIMGPSLTQRTDSTSIQTMIQLGNGTFKMGAPDFYFGFVDVRDVARAHIKAGIKKEASGRHILCKKSGSFLDLARLLSKHFDAKKYKFPKKKLPNIMVWLFGPFMGFNWKMLGLNLGKPIYFDNSYTIKDLDFEFTPLEKTVKDHFQQLIEDKLV